MITIISLVDVFTISHFTNYIYMCDEKSFLWGKSLKQCSGSQGSQPEILELAIQT